MGGRWNHRGYPIIYCSESISLCVLEHLTRHKPQQLTNTFVVLKVIIPEDAGIEDFPHSAEINQYLDPTHSMLSREYGTDWLKEKRSLAFCAPSAAMMHDFNYMLNPRHELFSGVYIDEVLPLNIDPRVYNNTR